MLQVDKAVLSIITDEQTAKYITSYGDRVAVLSCQQTKCSTDKETLIQKLRNKIGTRKMRSVCAVWYIRCVPKAR